MSQRILDRLGHKVVSVLTAISYLLSTFSSCFADLPYWEFEGNTRYGGILRPQSVKLEEPFAHDDWVFKVTQEGEDLRLSVLERSEDTKFVERFSSVASRKDAGLRAFALNKVYDNFSQGECPHNKLHLCVGWDGTLHVNGLQAEQQRLGFYSFGAIEFEGNIVAKELMAFAPLVTVATDLKIKHLTAITPSLTYNWQGHPLDIFYSITAQGKMNLQARELKIGEKSALLAGGGIHAKVPVRGDDIGIVCNGKLSCLKNVLLEGNVFLGKDAALESNTVIQLKGKAQRLWGRLRGQKAEIHAQSLDDLKYTASSFHSFYGLKEAHLMLEDGGTFTKPIRMGGTLTIELSPRAKRDITNRTDLQANTRLAFLLKNRELINIKDVNYISGKYKALQGGDILTRDLYIEGARLQNDLGYIEATTALIDVRGLFYSSGILNVRGKLINNAWHTIIEQLQRKWTETITKKSAKKGKDSCTRTFSVDCSENYPKELSGVLGTGHLEMGHGKFNRPRTYLQKGGNVQMGRTTITLNRMEFKALQERSTQGYRVSGKGYAEKGVEAHSVFTSAAFGIQVGQKGIAKGPMIINVYNLYLRGAYIYSLDKERAPQIKAHKVHFGKDLATERCAPKVKKEKGGTSRSRTWYQTSFRNTLQAARGQVYLWATQITGVKPDLLNTMINPKSAYDNLDDLNLKQGQKSKMVHKNHKHRAQLAQVAGLTVGILANLLLPVAGTALAAAGNGAIVGASSQLASNLVMNGGRVDRTLRALVSPESLRSLVVTAGTAGLMHNLNLPARPQGFEQQLQVHGTRTLINTGLTIAVDPRHAGRALRQGGLNFTVNVFAGTAANAISAAYNNGNGSIDYIAHKVMHALVGATSGAALSHNRGAGALAGAVGAVTAEIAGEVIADLNGGAANIPRPELEKIAAATRIVAVIVAAVGGQNIDIAATTATNAIENNFLNPSRTHEQAMQRQELADKAADNLAALAGRGIPVAQALRNNLLQYAGQFEAIQTETSQLPFVDQGEHLRGVGGARLVAWLIPETYGDVALLMVGGTASRFMRSAQALHHMTQLQRMINTGPRTVRTPLLRANQNGVTLTLEFKDGMNLRDFNRKVTALQDLAERGKLAKATVVRDKKVADEFRVNLISRAKRTWGTSEPERYVRNRDYIRKLDADHLHDLQLLGIDQRFNLGMLNRGVNRSLGPQIAHQLKNVPVGTKVTKVIVRKAKQ